MNINNLSFTGRYVLKGKNEQVCRAMNTIKSVKKNSVEFLQIPCGESRITVVATDEDKKALIDKKRNPNLSMDIRKMCAKKDKFLSNLFNYIFSTDKDALIIQGDTLPRFALPTSSINYSTGESIKKFNAVEKFVDGSCKKYSSKGRLSEITYSDGTKEELFANGARRITRADGSVESISGKIPSYATSKPFDEKPEAGLSLSKAIEKSISLQQEPAKKPVEVKQVEQVEKFEQKTLEVVKPIERSFNPDNDILDKKGRLSQRLFDDGTKADYYYRGNSTTPLFAYYSDGHFESELGIVDKKNGTISLPYRDGIREVLDKNGALVSYIFPDGTVKNYDKYQNITEKIYPDGKIEFFNRSGRMYLTLHPDGTKEYSKLIV